jgi:hypothetical protein
MIKTFKGSYQYDSERAQQVIGHPRTNFTIEMELFEDNTFKGSVQDDEKSGGMNGIGTITGEVYKNAIYFEKHMPEHCVIDVKANSRYKIDDKHPVIIYQGKADRENYYRGTWAFEKKWAFLFGIIPFRYIPGKGTWEMELVEGKG